MCPRSAHDLQQGFLLIEDLGSSLYLPALNEDTVDALYGDAMDALLRMQTRRGRQRLPPFDHEVLRADWRSCRNGFSARHLVNTLDGDDADVLEARST
jgi:aminoglycoside/choline kinase family phosphotransferase